MYIYCGLYSPWLIFLCILLQRGLSLIKKKCVLDQSSRLDCWAWLWKTGWFCYKNISLWFSSMHVCQTGLLLTPISTGIYFESFVFQEIRIHFYLLKWIKTKHIQYNRLVIRSWCVLLIVWTLWFSLSFLISTTWRQKCMVRYLVVV